MLLTCDQCGDTKDRTTVFRPEPFYRKLCDGCFAGQQLFRAERPIEVDEEEL